jgi:hypothetical protein
MYGSWGEEAMVNWKEISNWSIQRTSGLDTNCMPTPAGKLWDLEEEPLARHILEGRPADL